MGVRPRGLMRSFRRRDSLARTVPNVIAYTPTQPSPIEGEGL